MPALDGSELERLRLRMRDAYRAVGRSHGSARAEWLKAAADYYLALHPEDARWRISSVEPGIPSVDDIRARAAVADHARQAMSRTASVALNHESWDRQSAQLGWAEETWQAVLTEAFWAAQTALQAGDPGGLEYCVRFLEADPWLFRSGYVKRTLIYPITRVELDEPMCERLRRVVLTVVDDPRRRREIRHYGRLAYGVGNAELWAELERRATSDDPQVRYNAAKVLETWEQITHAATSRRPREPLSLKALVERQLRPVRAWLAGTQSALDANLAYWQVRRERIDTGDGSTGPAAPWLSAIDTAMDAFNPDPNRDPDQVDEEQLRVEVEAALAGLRALGLVEWLADPMGRLQRAIERLHREDNGRSQVRLPSEPEVAAAEAAVGVRFPPSYRRFLLEASNVSVGTLEPAVIDPGAGHRDLRRVTSLAWTGWQVPRHLLPFCEDNASFYCLDPAGRVVYLDHNGTTNESWPDLAAWINEVWIDQG